MKENQCKNIYLSDINLAARYDVDRTSVWRWIKTRNFPSPVKLTPGCTRWHLADVESWEKSRAEVAQ